MLPPTARQLEILLFIAENIVTRGYAPTLREIGARFDIKSTNGPADHIQRLVSKGLLTNSGIKRHRALRLTEAGRVLLGYQPAVNKSLPSAAPRVSVNFGMQCGRCGAKTFTLDRPCVICSMLRRRAA